MKLSKNINKHFVEVISMIKQARYAAIKSVNAEQIKLYWQVGEYISRKLEGAQWGEGVVDRLADYIQTNNPEFKGFTRRGLYRMRQFYETYRQKRFVSAVLTQISWTNHLLILSKTKTKEEREFYLALGNLGTQYLIRCQPSQSQRIRMSNRPNGLWPLRLDQKRGRT